MNFTRTEPIWHLLCDHEQELPPVHCGCAIGADHYTRGRLVRVLQDFDQCVIYKRETLTDCVNCGGKIVRAIQTDNWNHVEDDGLGTLTYMPTKHYGQPVGSSR